MASIGKPDKVVNEPDMISELPDPLICQILYHLSTKDSVRTSVLSTRWRTLWHWVSSLDLSYRDFHDLDALVNFGDSFFDRVSYIDKVELVVDTNYGDVDDPSYVSLWIDAAVKRKIQHLDVQDSPDSSDSFSITPKSAMYHQMPLSLYICETLVSLKLRFLEVILPDSDFISLPCLKILHLRSLWNPNGLATFERLVSSCPVLEELEISERLYDKAVQVFRVISGSLNKVKIIGLGAGSNVVIDAPRLGFLSIDSNLSESYMVTNMDSTNVKLVINLGYGFGDFDETSSLLLPPFGFIRRFEHVVLFHYI